MTRAARLLGAIGCALALAACTRSYTKAHIEGTDLESRYPPVVRDATHGLVEAAAVALVLFTGWLAADVALRRATRKEQGGALLTAGALVAILTVGALIVGSSGDYPSGRAYELAVFTSDWVGPVAFVAGVSWMIRGFRTGPGDRGEAVWGLFLVVVGLVVTTMIVSSSSNLWLCC